jgi:hypothetical protein
MSTMIIFLAIPVAIFWLYLPVLVWLVCAATQRSECHFTGFRRIELVGGRKARDFEASEFNRRIFLHHIASFWLPMERSLF